MAMLHACPMSLLHLGLAGLALPGAMRGRELPPQHAVIPILTLFLCCNQRGNKKTNPNNPFGSCR